MSLSEPTPDEQLAALSGSGDRPPVGPVSTYPTWLRTLGLWVAAIATVVLAGSAVAYWQDARTSHRIQTSGVRTSAVVAAVHNHTVVSGPDREGNYTRTTSAILDVRTTAGRVVTVHYPYRSPYQVGEQIVVLVDPAHPARGEIPGSPQTSGPAAALLCAGGALICLGVMARWYWRRRHSSADA